MTQNTPPVYRTQDYVESAVFLTSIAACADELAALDKCAKMAGNNSEAVLKLCSGQDAELKKCQAQNAGPENYIARFWAQREAAENPKCVDLHRQVDKCCKDFGGVGDPILSAKAESADVHPCMTEHWREIVCGSAERLRKLRPDMFKDSKNLFEKLWADLNMPGKFS